MLAKPIFVLKLHFHDDQFRIIEKCPKCLEIDWETPRPTIDKKKLVIKGDETVETGALLMLQDTYDSPGLGKG